jgi:hypothetical protein
MFCGLCGGAGDEAGPHDACEARLQLEPPRYCVECRRRLKVQVHPRGWTAECVEHGTVSS